MMNKEIFEQLRNYIRKNRFDILFKSLRAYFDSTEDIDSIDKIESRYRQWKSDDRNGITTYADIRPNQVRNAIIDFISDKEKDSEEIPKGSILFIGASAENMDPLDIKRELDAIENLVNDKHKYLKVESILDAAKSDLFTYTLSAQPRILHFACHSNETGIFLVDKNGENPFLDLNRLKEFISKFSGTIECVILNSCSSKDIAEAINEFIPYVMATNQEIQDKASILYSQGFYTWIANENKKNPDYLKAHEAGLAFVKLLNLPDGWTIEPFIKPKLNLS